jgi:DNA-binding transcriptional MerR regulator/effector-binding domain-containing protein
MGAVPTALTIGDFSRMTHLSAKTLRHYHRVGLLEPAHIDPSNGYRYYTTDQVATAQVIRRFRDLDMPIDTVRAVLAAPDVSTRNALIGAHLDRLQAQLKGTQAAVTSLQHLLEQPESFQSIAYRSVPAVRTVAISATIEGHEIGSWWSAAFVELYEALRVHRVEPAGAGGGLYASELFADDRGDATVFVPVDTMPAGAGTGRVRELLVPAAELAIAVHTGPDDDIDLTYGALGKHVTERALGVDGPVREYYVVAAIDTPEAARWRTEIGWPIFRTTPS